MTFEREAIQSEINAVFARYPPGSDAALDAGCRCPVLDNGHGRGILGDGKRNGWWINGSCSLHGRQTPKGEEIGS